MLLFSVDSRIVGGAFLIAIVGWGLFKLLESVSTSSGNVSDTRPTCARCGDLLPAGQQKCISCGHEITP